MPVGDPVLDYDGLQYYHSKLTAEVTQQIDNEFDERHVPIFIDGATVGTEFYVNGSSGSDTTGDGSQSTPWKTIAHAAQAVAQGYNINSHDVRIYVAGGTYTDKIALTSYTATTGSITIEPLPDSGAVNVAVTVSGSGQAIHHTGGGWTLKGLNLKTILAEQLGATTEGKRLVLSADTPETITLIDCNLEFQDLTAAFSSGSVGYVLAYLLFSRAGNIVVRSTSAVSWSGTRANAYVSWMYASFGGVLNAAGQTGAFNVSGAYTNFLYVSGGVYRDDSTTTWNSVDSPTGRRFLVNNGGTLITSQTSAAALQAHFPGSTEGTVSGGNTLPSLQQPFSGTPIYSATLAEDIPVGGADGRYTIPFGTPVTSIAFEITTPAAASAVSFYLRAKYNDADLTEPIFGVSNFVNTSEQKTIGFIKNDHGINSMLVAHGASSASHLTTEMFSTLRYVGNAQITEMSITATSSVLPAGTTITVYGATEV